VGLPGPFEMAKFSLIFILIWSAVASYFVWSGSLLRPVLGPVPAGIDVETVVRTPMLPPDRYQIQLLIRPESDLAQPASWLQRAAAARVSSGADVYIELVVRGAFGREVLHYGGDLRNWGWNASESERAWRLWGEVSGSLIDFRAWPLERYDVRVMLIGDGLQADDTRVYVALRAERDDGSWGLMHGLVLSAAMFLYAAIVVIGRGRGKWMSAG
jgi:hypothetical protein